MTGAHIFLPISHIQTRCVHTRDTNSHRCTTVFRRVSSRTCLQDPAFAPSNRLPPRGSILKFGVPSSTVGYRKSVQPGSKFWPTSLRPGTFFLPLFDVPVLTREKLEDAGKKTKTLGKDVAEERKKERKNNPLVMTRTVHQQEVHCRRFPLGDDDLTVLFKRLTFLRKRFGSV